MQFKNNNIYLSDKMMRNFVTYDSIDYMISNIDDRYSSSKGSNSNVFKLTNPQTDEIFAIKFCKFDENNPLKPTNNIKRISRFDREIEALQISKANGFQNVVEYYFDDYLTINDRKFHYYVMEKADSDLGNYLHKNDLSAQQRFLLCIQILNGIKDLHSEEIYHRDIKPDNILFIKNVWKIGDLGLVHHRNSDFDVVEVGERIGPIGWLSPEAANKYLNEGAGRENKYGFDCSIDAFSDIFQLGKLFWYIFQGNIPIGQIIERDFMLGDKEIFEILYAMLNHSKFRPSLNDVESGFQSRFEDYAI